MNPHHSPLDAPEPQDWQRSTGILEDSNSKLLDEVEELREKVDSLHAEVRRTALLSKNMEELVHHLREWLSWDDWDREGMSAEAKAFISRSLRTSVEGTLRRMPHE